MVALCIITYILVGFLLSMLLTFITKRAGLWDGDESIILAVFCIILWPLYVFVGIFCGIVGGLSAFYEWFSDCIKERNKEE